MPLHRLRIPVLVVHHEHDGCRYCAFGEIGRLMDKLDRTPRKELMTFKGGRAEGDPCEAMGHHGFNGLEDQVVAAIAGWVTARQ
jgi:hypothetical protein